MHASEISSDRINALAGIHFGGSSHCLAKCVCNVCISLPIPVLTIDNYTTQAVSHSGHHKCKLLKKQLFIFLCFSFEQQQSNMTATGNTHINLVKVFDKKLKNQKLSHLLSTHIKTFFGKIFKQNIFTWPTLNLFEGMGRHGETRRRGGEGLIKECK